MHSEIGKPSPPKLSICISTFNRGNFIGATLESIVAQATNQCEIVVLDGGSTDDTQTIVCEYDRRFDCIRYIRQDTNNGIDRDYDRVVELAFGEYCWLMTDDDLLKPGAIAAVLSTLQRDISLVIVNAEFKNLSMTAVLQERRLNFSSDRIYGPRDMDRLFVEAGHTLTYIGGAVIKRSLWLARDRMRYYGTYYIHVGVIFQEPLPGDTVVLADPLISYRSGNAHTFSPHVIEVLWVRWPSLVATLALSDSTKNIVGPTAPWKQLREVLLWRGMGLYSLIDYRRWVRPRLKSMSEGWIPASIALLPGVLANTICLIHFSMTDRRYRNLVQPSVLLQGLRDSRFHISNWLRLQH